MVIGVLGGMGSYATLDVFRRFLEVFPAKKEWERPRIVIDNNCTMPSRVVAALYGTDREKLVVQLSSSVKSLIDAGCTHIFFACNTSHIFLDEVYKNVPNAKGKIYNIIELLAKDLADNEDISNEFALVATEGTVETHIYQKIFENFNLKIIEPTKDKYEAMRKVIESVKQNNISHEYCLQFIELVKSFENKNVILGCTEFPVIYHKFQREIDNLNIKIFDPIDSVLNCFKRLYVNQGELECKH